MEINKFKNYAYLKELYTSGNNMKNLKYETVINKLIISYVKLIRKFLMVKIQPSLSSTCGTQLSIKLF